MNATVPSHRGAAVLAVTSGKGGVGKTNLVVNLAVALSRLRYRVAILDGDLGLGNIDVLLGLTPAGHIGDVLTGEKALADVLLAGPAGIRILPASSGLRDLTTLAPKQRIRLAQAIAELRREHDFLLIDTASGISDTVVETMQMAERVIVVSTPEPTAIVDAYAMAKVLTMATPAREIGVVVNAVRDADEAVVTFRQLDTAAGRFLHRSLRYYGYVPQDAAVLDAIAIQRAIVDCDPQASASRSFRLLASRIAGMGPVTGNGLRLARGFAAGRQQSGGPASTGEVPQCA